MLPLPNRYYRYVADYAIAYENKDLLYDVYAYQLVREQPAAGSWRLYVYYDSDEDRSPFVGIGDANFYLAEAETEQAGIRLMDTITTAEKTMVGIMGIWERQKLMARNEPEKLAAAWKYLGREALSPYVDLVEQYLAELPQEVRSNYCRFALVCNYYDAVRAIKRYWSQYEQAAAKQAERAKKKLRGVMVLQPKQLQKK